MSKKNKYDSFLIWQKSRITRELINPGKEDLTKLKEQIQDLKKNFNNDYNEINKYYQSLFKENEEEWKISLKSKIDNKIENLEKLLQQYNNLVSEIKSFSNKIEEEWETWYRFQIDNFIEELEENRKKLIKLWEYHTKIFWDEDTNQIWLEKYLNDKKLELEKLHKDNETKLNKFYNDNKDKYQNLFEQIESLLPWATSAWLWKSYKTMRIKFEKENELWSWVSIASIITLFLCGLLSLISKGWIAEKQWVELLYWIIAKLPVAWPLIWLAIFSWKRQQQAKRLEQEYIHKETLTTTFEWYRRELEKIIAKNKDSKILMKEFMNNVIQMSSFNPSETLDKKVESDSPIKDISDKALDKIWNIVDKKIPSLWINNNENKKPPFSGRFYFINLFFSSSA